MKGLTRLTLDELKDKCASEGIAMPDSKPTRGLLMKLLRENAPPTGDEVVCFGMYKGYLYKEVNEKYLQWAMEEVAANPQHSLDLARLARWAQARSTTPGTGSRPSAPEVGAVVPLPKAAYLVPKVTMPGREEPSKTVKDFKDQTPGDGGVERVLGGGMGNRGPHQGHGGEAGDSTTDQGDRGQAGGQG